MTRFAATACALLVLSSAIPIAPAAADSAYAPLVVRLASGTIITIKVVQNSGQCTLVNSSSNWAALNFGQATVSTDTSCGTYASGSTYSLTTNFSVKATCSGTCATWNLSAQLASAAQTNVTWTYGGTTLSTTSSTIASGLTYGTSQSEAFAVQVTSGSSTPSDVQQGVTFTATDVSSGTTATATLDAQLINQPGIAIYLQQDASGATMTGGAFNASLAFGTISAYGSLSSGVSRPVVGPSSYTVQTIFDIDVVNGTSTSTSYTLQGTLGSTAPTGLTYTLGGVALTTSAQTITTTGSYNTSQGYTLGIVVLTASSKSGGPSTGASSDTIELTATAN